MKRRGLVAGVIAVVFFSAGAGAAGCVGDEPNAGGPSQDGSADQAAQGDGQATDAATDAASCAACDGSCYHGMCNGNAVLQVTAGDGFACALLAEGSVWCWGDNSVGQVANPPSSTGLPPTQIAGLSNVTQISAGLVAVCAVEADASVWCWGRNDEGDLGHDPGTSGDVVCGAGKCNAVPTKVNGVTAKEVGTGRTATCAVTTTGNVACWGWNGEAVLGLGDAPSFTSSSTPQIALGLSNIVHLAVNTWPGENACAIDTSNNLWCWGNNEFGQLAHTPGTAGDTVTACQEPLGAGDLADCNTTPAKISQPPPDGDGGDMSNVSSVASGWATCATQLNGTLSCWGINRAGQLTQGTIGSGTSVMMDVPALSNASLVAGNETMCARLATGDVYCWGSDTYDVPGTSGLTDAGCTAFTGVSAPCAIAPVKVVGLNARALAVSSNAVVAITSDGKVVAWGDNSAGELGHAIGTKGDDGNDLNPTPTAVEGLP